MNADKYVSLIPHDLNYFREWFVGRPMPGDWQPPPVTISGTSKKLPDVMSWMTAAPVVSEKGMKALESLGNCLQFLHFHDVKGKRYFAMNVICVETHLLDLDRSSIAYDKDHQPLYLERAAFVTSDADMPPVFKVGFDDGKVFGPIFVTRTFAEVAISNKLSGFDLADPGRGGLRATLSGESQNVVPGIVG
jgi:hypothetical protein